MPDEKLHAAVLREFAVDVKRAREAENWNAIDAALAKLMKNDPALDLVERRQ